MTKISASSTKTSPRKARKNTTKQQHKKAKKPVEELMNEEEKKVWQQRQRNNKAAEKYRTKKIEQLKQIEDDVEHLKGKCKAVTSEEQFQEFENELEKNFPKEASEAEDIESETSKFGNRYEPSEDMSKEEKTEWLKKKRILRNRESAAKSRIKKQKHFEELEIQLEYWNKKLMRGKYHQQESSAFVPKTMNDFPFCISTGCEGHKETLMERELSFNVMAVMPEIAFHDMSEDQGGNSRQLMSKSVSMRLLIDHQCDSDSNMRVLHIQETLNCSKSSLLHEKVHSFTCRQNSFAQLSIEEYKNIFSKNYVLCTEQQSHQINSSARMQHYNPINVISLDQRTAMQCDIQLGERISKMREEIKSKARVSFSKIPTQP